MKKAFVLMAIAVLALSMQAMGATLTNEHSTDFGCETCHTVHDANTSVSGAPLWGGGIAPSAGFTPYDSDTLDATVDQPTGNSLLCLSCHDGVTITDPNLVPDPNSSGNVSRNLSDTHPISFTYDDGDTDEFEAIGTVQTAGLIGVNDDQVQCASCHDVHRTAAASTQALRLTTPTLCTTCHKK
ncbi:MAG: cytochrome c3 family protein [Planctomycetota bacterium]|jgi:predicted CXXCH cytochrome family protein